MADQIDKVDKLIQAIGDSEIEIRIPTISDDDTYHKTNEDDDETIRIYPVEDKRWLILFCYFLLMAQNAQNDVTFATVSSIVSDIYQVKATIVNTTATVFFLAFILINFPSFIMIERWGMSNSVSTSQQQSILNLLTFCKQLSLYSS